MACQTCAQSVKVVISIKPPRFAITNEWTTEQVPSDSARDDIDEISAAILARITMFTNVYPYVNGAPKLIRGHYIFHR